VWHGEGIPSHQGRGLGKGSAEKAKAPPLKNLNFSLEMQYVWGLDVKRIIHYDTVQYFHFYNARIVNR